MAMEKTIYFEVERVVNLIRGFGWNKTGEQILGNKVVLTLEKEVDSAEQIGSNDSPG
jgi:hypothetical protein